MQKVKLNLTSQQIHQFDAGNHEAVRDGGKLYLLVSDEEGSEDAGAAPATKSAPAKKAPAAAKEEVADDTAPAPAKKAAATKAAPAAKAAPAGRSRAAAKPAPAEEEDELTEVENLDELEIDEEVVCQLNIEGEEDKMWDATVVGWKKPKGSKTEELFVLFAEDGTEDFLREGDRVFRKGVAL